MIIRQCSILSIHLREIFKEISQLTTTQNSIGRLISGDSFKIIFRLFQGPKNPAFVVPLKTNVFERKPHEQDNAGQMYRDGRRTNVLETSLLPLAKIWTAAGYAV